jgi:hypothetical protein
MVFGVLLIAVGVIALLVKTGVISGSIWSYTWPTVLIILGLSFIFRRVFWRHPRHWISWHDDRDRGQ